MNRSEQQQTEADFYPPYIRANSLHIQNPCSVGLKFFLIILEVLIKNRTAAVLKI